MISGFKPIIEPLGGVGVGGGYMVHVPMIP